MPNYRVLPFEITMPSGRVYQFRDSRANEALDVRVRDKWRNDGDQAALTWRASQREVCEPNGYDDSIAFEVKRDGQPFGTFGIYAMRPLVEGKPFNVSAMVAPILKGLNNTDEATRDNFWRRIFHIMQWILDNPLPTTNQTGKKLTIDHWRMPDRDVEGCVEQHEWIGLDDYISRHVTKQVDRHATRGIPVRMLKTEV